MARKTEFKYTDEFFVCDYPMKDVKRFKIPIELFKQYLDAKRRYRELSDKISDLALEQIYKMGVEK